MEQPFITVYTRLLDTSTQQPLTGWTRVLQQGAISSGTFGTIVDNNAVLNYGILNGISGGSSEYIVEFDIWNNEPGFSGGLQPIRVCDATNIRLIVQDSASLASIANVAPQVYPNQPGQPVVYARCVTNDQGQQFVPFTNQGGFTAIYGNVNPTVQGTLFGSASGGDHALVQTKVMIPAGVPSNTYNFVFGLEFDYDSAQGS